MKSFHIHPLADKTINSCSSGNGFFWKRWYSYAITIMFVISLSSCFLKYFQVDNVDKTNAAEVQKLIDGGKYFILHANKQTFALTNVKMNNEHLEGEVNPLPPEHQKFLNPRNRFATRFKQSEKDIVLYEVHLYTAGKADPQSHVSIPLKDFEQMDVYELNKERTAKSKTMSIVGISLTTAGAIAAIIGIVAIDREINRETNPSPTQPTEPIDWGSCSPQVFWMNGNEKKLFGILYSGALFAPLQRKDYMPLAGLTPIDNQFHFQIRGSENEEQFIHDAKLLQVTHDINSTVLLDHSGKVLPSMHHGLLQEFLLIKMTR